MGAVGDDPPHKKFTEAAVQYSTAGQTLLGLPMAAEGMVGPVGPRHIYMTAPPPQCWTQPSTPNGRTLHDHPLLFYRIA